MKNMNQKFQEKKSKTDENHTKTVKLNSLKIKIILKALLKKNSLHTKKE